MTASGFIAGTPQFMSPEQANGEPVDHRSDLFSLGSVIYTMIAGRPPFRAESSIAVLRRIADHRPRRLQEITQSIPLWLEAIVAKLHEKVVDSRFQSASELASLLSKAAMHLEAPHQFVLPPSIQRIMNDWKGKLYRERVQGYFSTGAFWKRLEVVFEQNRSDFPGSFDCFRMRLNDKKLSQRIPNR